ncbi:MAG: hypothetical protein MR051_09340 [Lentisphaeria bacterium]|nr:hypothetical protein [Lentisphaeria bacterium]
MFRKKEPFLAALLAVPLLVHAAIEMEVREETAPNLLKNPGFADLRRPRYLPEYWTFENCSRKAGFEYNFPNGEAYLFTSGRLFGYLVQSGIPVEEGKTYYVGAKVKLTTTTLLWIATPDYRDNLDQQNHPRSNTNFFACLMRPEQGKELFAELRYFIRPELLRPFGADEWNDCDSEFTVPVGKGVKTYTYRIGSLGGAEGWIRVKEPVFRLAERRVHLTIRGRGVASLCLHRDNGVVIRRYPLDEAAEVQEIDLILPSTIKSYYVEVSTLENGKIRRSL